MVVPSPFLQECNRRESPLDSVVEKYEFQPGIFDASQADMNVFEKIAELDEIPDGEGRSFQIGDRVIAVFRVANDYFAIDDQCPHMGASLSAGHLEDCVVSCPLHAWRFDVRDGTWRDNPRVSIDSFRTEVREDGVYVDTHPVTRPQDQNGG